MPQALRAWIEQLRESMGRDELTAIADAELAKRFVDSRDELAFAELVRRHAPAVYSMARRHLNDPASLDDAFQATFIILARKIGSLQSPEKLSAWLCGVADRVARTLKRREKKRAGKTISLDSIAEPSSSSNGPETDLRTVLDEELIRLPEPYREAIRLCDIDGVTRRAAAELLKLPESTLSNRLVRARALLGRRLLRRGVSLGAGLALSSVANAEVPVQLLAMTTRLALTETIPAELAPLLIEVPTPMNAAKKLLIALTGSLLLGGTITGVVLMNQSPKPTPPTTGTELAEVKRPTTIATMAVRPDANKPKEIQPEPKFGESVSAYAFSADGKTAVMAQDFSGTKAGGAKISVFDASNWKETKSLKLEGENSEIMSVSLMPDGKTAIVAIGMNGVFKWDIASDKLGAKLISENRPYYGLRLSHDGKVLAMYTGFGEKNGPIRLWDANTGAVLRDIDTKGLAIYGPPTFTDGGATIAAVSYIPATDGKVFRGVIEWDVKTGEERKRFEMLKCVGRPNLLTSIDQKYEPLAMALAYSPDGKQLIVGGGFLGPHPDALIEPVSEENRGKVAWSGAVWAIDRETGKLLKTPVDRRVFPVTPNGLWMSGKKLFIRMEIPYRSDSILGGRNDGNRDLEYLEIQKWDTETWTRDWIKFCDFTERWKVLAGEPGK